MSLFKRQIEDTSSSDYAEQSADAYRDYDCYEENRCSWWFGQTGSAVRYAIVAVLFFTLFFYFVFGYWHARHRLRKNLPPLAYHRWMVKQRSPRYYNHYPHGAPMYNPQNPYYAQPYHPDSYGMQGSMHAPPPPAYHAGDAPPPVYQPPPQGSSKVAADQNYQQTRVGESSSEVQAPGAAAAAASRGV